VNCFGILNYTLSLNTELLITFVIAISILIIGCSLQIISLTISGAVIILESRKIIFSKENSLRQMTQSDLIYILTLEKCF